MHLLCDASLDHLFFIGPVLTFNLGLHVLTFVLLHPLAFVHLLFLKFNVLLSVLINILKKINAGLILAIPLLFSVFPLLGVFFSYKFVDHPLICLLVRLLLCSKLLKLNCFVTMSHLFFVFNLLNLALSFDSSMK